MPEKLDKCVEELIKKGHSEEEAWAICKKKIAYILQMKYEKAKRILTGQLITDEYLENKRKEFCSDEKED
jgi:hypothetical protein